MVPVDGKVVIIQAESEFQSLTADSDLSESQHEAYPVVHSPSRGLLEQGAGGGAAFSLPQPPQQPPLHVGARNAAHVQSAQDIQTMCKVKSELESTTSGPQQPVGHPLSPPQRGTPGVLSHMHGWSTRHQVGNDQGLAQGSASMQRYGLLAKPRDQQGLTQASDSPQSQDQGGEEASGQHHSQLNPDQLATQQRHFSLQRKWHHPDALPLPADAHIGHARFSAGPSQSSQPPTGHPQSPTGHPQSPAGHPQLPAGHPQSSAGHPQQLCHGLRVTLEGKQTAYHGEDALQALTSVAQGCAQCCVTGPAFAQMLGRADHSVLDMVLQNVVVFARMQPQQKGQVMELLGARGLHLVLDGQQHHIQVAACNLCLPLCL